ncbi:hypothetical protein [Kistimonas scapharcae]|uniref:hypothetical protein n=1 Tax=Kistimonas scapharcae TaxID=1036133 RepID=UPI0031ECF5D2
MSRSTASGCSCGPAEHASQFLGVCRKDRTNRTTTGKTGLSPVMTRVSGDFKNRTICEPEVNRFRYQTEPKSEPVRNKNSLKINVVQFLVQSGAVFDRTTKTQTGRGLQRNFHYWFSWCGLSDIHPQKMAV